MSPMLGELFAACASLGRRVHLASPNHAAPSRGVLASVAQARYDDTMDGTRRWSAEVETDNYGVSGLLVVSKNVATQYDALVDLFRKLCVLAREFGALTDEDRRIISSLELIK